MTITSDEIRSWLKNFEDQIMDRKSIQILSHASDLADLMVAFANNKFVPQDFGGIMIIGIDDNGNVERFVPQQKHEELIMNVARDKCVPSILPLFEKVDFNGSVVYVVTIPKMTSTPYQVKISNILTHKIRVGSTVRDPNPEELSRLYSTNNPPESGIELPIDNYFVKFVLEKGRSYFKRKYGRLDIPPCYEIKILVGIAIGLMVPLLSLVSLFLYTRSFTPDHMPLMLIFGFLPIGSGICFSIIGLIRKRKCEKCGSNFTIEKIKSKLVAEKPLYYKNDRIRLRRIENNTYQCKFCNYRVTRKEIHDYDAE